MTRRFSGHTWCVGRGPKNVKLFINTPATPDFDDVASLEPVQTLTLSPADLAGDGVILPLRFVKFQNVDKLVVRN